MLGLWRGLQVANLRCNPRALLLSIPSLAIYSQPPTTTYIPLRHYAKGKDKPRKPVFLAPSRRPLPPPSVDYGIVADVNQALRSPNISTQVRGVLRHMVHPVVIVTTSTSPDPEDWRAMTLSSFTSLSLSPDPLITFNIKTPSSCASAMHARKRFIIHAMLPTTRAADFAARFSQPYMPGQEWKYTVRPNSVEEPLVTLSPEEKEELLKDESLTKEEISELTGTSRKEATVLETGQFGRINVLVDETTDELPALKEEVMFRLYCTPKRTISIQDHEIWVAKVERIEYPRHDLGKYGIEPFAPLSLLYGDRSFRETGLHMITAHNRFRRYFRRKMEYEAEVKETKKRKLLGRLERVRKAMEAEERGFDAGRWAVKQLEEETMDLELVEMDSQSNEEEGPAVMDINTWFAHSEKRRLAARRILPTPAPDIVPREPPEMFTGIKPEEEDENLDGWKTRSEGRRQMLNWAPPETNSNVSSARPPPSESEDSPILKTYNSYLTGKFGRPGLKRQQPSNSTPRFTRRFHAGIILNAPDSTPPASSLPAASSPSSSAPPETPHSSTPPNLPSSSTPPSLISPPPPSPPRPPSQTQLQTQEMHLADDLHAELEISIIKHWFKLQAEEKIQNRRKWLQPMEPLPPFPLCPPSSSSQQQDQTYIKRFKHASPPPPLKITRTYSPLFNSFVTNPKLSSRSFSSTSAAFGNQEKYTPSSSSSSPPPPPSSEDPPVQTPRIRKFVSAHMRSPAEWFGSFRIVRGSVLYSKFGIGRAEKNNITTTDTAVSSPKSEQAKDPSESPTITTSVTTTTTSATSTFTPFISSYESPASPLRITKPLSTPPPLRIIKVSTGPTIDPTTETIYKPFRSSTPASPPTTPPEDPPRRLDLASIYAKRTGKISARPLLSKPVRPPKIIGPEPIPLPPGEAPNAFYVYPPTPIILDPSLGGLNRLRKLRKAASRHALHFDPDQDILDDPEITWDPPPEENDEGSLSRRKITTEKFDIKKDKSYKNMWVRSALARSKGGYGPQGQGSGSAWGMSKRGKEREEEILKTGGRKQKWLDELQMEVMTFQEKKEFNDVERGETVKQPKTKEKKETKMNVINPPDTTNLEPESEQELEVEPEQDDLYEEDLSDEAWGDKDLSDESWGDEDLLDEAWGDKDLSDESWGDEDLSDESWGDEDLEEENSSPAAGNLTERQRAQEERLKAQKAEAKREQRLKNKERLKRKKLRLELSRSAQEARKAAEKKALELGYPWPPPKKVDEGEKRTMITSRAVLEGRGLKKWQVKVARKKERKEVEEAMRMKRDLGGE